MSRLENVGVFIWEKVWFENNYFRAKPFPSYIL